MDVVERKLFYLKHKPQIDAKNRLGRRSPFLRYRKLITSAKRRNISVDLSFDQWQALVSQNCVYHDGPLPMTGYGIDRLDSNGGYTADNVVPCCRICNDLKGPHMSFEETKAMAQAIYKVNPTRFDFTPKEEKPEVEVEPPPGLITRDWLVDLKLQFAEPEFTCTFDQTNLYSYLIIARGSASVRVFHQPLQDMGYRPTDIQAAIPDACIFRDDEFEKSMPIVVSLLRHRLGLSKSVYARDLEVREISSSLYIPFFRANHLMGETSYPTLALLEGEEVKMALSFSYSAGTLTLQRVAVEKGLSVVGGFSRLLEYAISLRKPAMVSSFVDLRYHQAHSYSASNFQKTHTAPSWRWTDGTNTYNRRKCRANMDARGFTETEHALELGWWKIKDAGQAHFARYVKKEDIKPLIVPHAVAAEERKLEYFYIGMRKKGYEDKVQALRQAGMEALTSFEDYNNLVGAKKILKIKCSQGHIFTRTAERVKHNTICPECTGKSNKGGAFLEKLSGLGWTYLGGDYKNKESVLEVHDGMGNIYRRPYKWLRDNPPAILQLKSNAINRKD